MADTLNVSFLRGTQAKLNDLKSFQPGAFYLTSDTDRLYFAQAANELVYLNRYISTVDLAQKDTLQPNKTFLPPLTDVSVGDFYYVAEGNILCTKATENAQTWTQINPPDTNTDISVSKLDFDSAQDNNGNIKVTYTLTQQNKDVITGSNIGEATEITGNFLIKGSDIGAVVSNISLDTKATVANNAATIELEGTGVAGDADGFVIKGGNNVSIKKGDNNEVVIESQYVDHTYTFGSAANSTNISLQEQPSGTKVDVAIVAKANDDTIKVSGTNANEIVIAHKSFDAIDSDIGAQDAAYGQNVNIVSGIKTENGHVTEIKTSTIKMPEEAKYSISAISADNEGILHVTLKDKAGTEVTTNSADDLFYTIGDAKLYNQTNLANYFYTKAEIDNTLKGANAMTFIGSVGKGGTKGTELPTEGVKAGDTYIVVGDSVVIGSNKEGTEGDLFIASGTENADGNLIIVDWVHVPAGDEIDTTYTLSAIAGQGLVLKDHNQSEISKIAIEAGTAMSVSSDGKITVAHANVTREDPSSVPEVSMSGEATVNVVTGVTTNAQGHVTAVNTSKLVMPKEVAYHIEGTTENKALLKDQAGNTDGIIEIVGKEGNLITVSSKSETANNKAIFEIEHNEVTVATTTGTPTDLKAKDTFTVITGVSNDGHGHLSGITTTEFTLPEDKDTTYTLSTEKVTASVASGVYSATAKSTLKDSAGSDCGTAEVKLESQTLALTATDSAIKAELVWGSF